MENTNKSTEETKFEGTTTGGGTVSAAELQEALSGIDLPASKQDLVDQANDNGADQKVISALERLPEREYHAITEIQQAFTGAQAS